MRSWTHSFQDYFKSPVNATQYVNTIECIGNGFTQKQVHVQKMFLHYLFVRRASKYLLSAYKSFFYKTSNVRVYVKMQYQLVIVYCWFGDGIVNDTLHWMLQGAHPFRKPGNFLIASGTFASGNRWFPWCLWPSGSSPGGSNSFQECAEVMYLRYDLTWSWLLMYSSFVCTFVMGT